MPARRGRPPSFERTAVLDALLFLFWERGYEATSQSAMIERAGISSSSLYNTFGNKPEVFDAVLARYNTMVYDLLATLREGTDGIGDIEAFFAEMAVDMRAQESPPGCLMVRTMTELGGRSGAPSTAARTSTYREYLADALREALGRSGTAGEIATDTVEAKASLALAVYVGALAVGASSSEEGARLMEAGEAMVRNWRSV